MARETIPVDLTMDETGHLCHLMMADEEFRNFVRTGEVSRLKHSFLTEETRKVVMTRLVILYKKLADANDILMGKKDG